MLGIVRNLVKSVWEAYPDYSFDAQTNEFYLHPHPPYWHLMPIGDQTENFDYPLTYNYPNVACQLRCYLRDFTIRDEIFCLLAS